MARDGGDVRRRPLGRWHGVSLFTVFLLVGQVLGAGAASAKTSDEAPASLPAPAEGTTRSGAYVAGWDAIIEHDVYYLASFTSPFDQPWEPTHEVKLAHRQGSAMFMYLEIPRPIDEIARGDHDEAIAAWFDRWCEVAWVNRDVVAPMAEMNGDWTVWNGLGKATTYKEAYRRVQSLAPCHVRWAYAPTAARGWKSYFPGDDVAYIPFVAPSVFAWSCRTAASSVVDTAATMGDHFGRPTILAQTGTSCSNGREAWHAELFAAAAEEGIFAVIPGHFPSGGQPHPPWDNGGWAWALQYTVNDARLPRPKRVAPPPRPHIPRTASAFISYI